MKLMKIRKIERKNLQQTTDPMEKNPKRQNKDSTGECNDKEI